MLLSGGSILKCMNLFLEKNLNTRLHLSVFLSRLFCVCCMSTVWIVPKTKGSDPVYFSIQPAESPYAVLAFSLRCVVCALTGDQNLGILG